MEETPLPSGEIAEKEKRIPLPIVKYDQALMNPENSYLVSFDSEKASRLLSTLGLSDHDIRSLKVSIVDNSVTSPDGREANAFYSNGVITISGGGVGRFLQRNLSEVNTLLSEGPQDENLESQLVSIVNDHTQQLTDSLFNHEVGHFVSDVSSKTKIKEALRRKDIKSVIGLLRNRLNLQFQAPNSAERVREEYFADNIKNRIDAEGTWGNIIQVTAKNFHPS